jgi:hypothetical protein
MFSHLVDDTQFAAYVSTGFEVSPTVMAVTLQRDERYSNEVRASPYFELIGVQNAEG